MLSYQHAYHAGNFADVLKHTVLIRALRYLKQKGKPLCYIDTHAGLGKYPFSSSEALKNKEWQNGIGKLWAHQDLSPGVAEYVEVIQEFNLNRQLDHYPGSPWIAKNLLGKNDRLFLYELHPAEYRQLKETVRGDRRIKAFRSDGLKDSLGLLPPLEHRGLVLIDPSYELAHEYGEVIETLKAMHRRFSTGCYVLWYPVVSRKRTRFMERALQSSGVKNIQLYELGIAPDSDAFGMTASGVFVVNPPWTLMNAMEAILPWLAAALGENGQGHYRAEQLVPE